MREIVETTKLKLMRSFKSFAALTLSLLFVFVAQAQNDKSTRPSPPAQVSKEVKGTTITIDYSKPSKRGRVIFGEKLQYGKVWRTGANETTWIEVSKDVKVEGETLAAGKYGLFTIPGEDEWIIIFSKEWDRWGTIYKEKDDVLRVKVKPSKGSLTDIFDIKIEDSGDVVLAWDETKVEFSIR